MASSGGQLRLANLWPNLLLLYHCINKSHWPKQLRLHVAHHCIFDLQEAISAVLDYMFDNLDILLKSPDSDFVESEYSTEKIRKSAI